MALAGKLADRRLLSYERAGASQFRRHPTGREREVDEEIFNMSVRKFLKKVGVTSQREIEQAVRAAVEAGTIGPNDKVMAKVSLTIDAVGLDQEIDGEIALN